MISLYLGSLISHINVFVLQSELQIPPLKWEMSQPSSMFAARDIIQTILGTFFLGHPVVVLWDMRHVYYLCVVYKTMSFVREKKCSFSISFRKSKTIRNACLKSMNEAENKDWIKPKKSVNCTKSQKSREKTLFQISIKARNFSYTQKY